LVPARQAEVSDLKLAVGVHEEVTAAQSMCVTLKGKTKSAPRLQVAVEDVRGVDVLQAAQGLVDERLEVCIGERLTGADLHARKGEII
jgi:hypothetical protein